MVWTFLKITIGGPNFNPPEAGPPDGGGMSDGSPSGENNMITNKRVVAVANGKIWYENIGET